MTISQLSLSPVLIILQGYLYNLQTILFDINALNIKPATKVVSNGSSHTSDVRSFPIVSPNNKQMT